MGLFRDSLKKWFYTQNSNAASRDALVPLLNANGTPKGSDTIKNLGIIGDFLCPKDEETFSFNGLNQKSGVYHVVDEPPTGVTDAIYIHFKTSSTQHYFRVVICFAADGASNNRDVYYRTYRSAWSNWYKITSNVLG